MRQAKQKVKAEPVVKPAFVWGAVYEPDGENDGWIYKWTNWDTHRVARSQMAQERWAKEWKIRRTVVIDPRYYDIVPKRRPARSKKPSTRKGKG